MLKSFFHTGFVVRDIESSLAFFVENIEAYCATVSQKGARFIGPPASLVHDGRMVRKVSYCQDSDNNWLEFVEVPE